jgi:zinc protease
VRRRVLPNGLVLLALENRTLPAVSLAAMVRAGSRHDPPERAGLAALVARMLDEGTERRSSLELATAIESVGGELDIGTGRETTQVQVTALAPDVAVAAELLAEILRRPRFEAGRLEPERQRMLADLRAVWDEPGEVAERAFFELVYGEHPYRRPVDGYESTVAAITADDLRRFHARFFVPNRTTLVIVGAIRPDEALDQLERRLGDWERGGEPESPAPVPSRGSTRQARKVRLEKEQTHILLGHVGIARTDLDFIPLQVLDTILGTGAAGTFTARIPYQLRDVEGLAYTVGSSITESAGLLPGVFEASLGTHPKNADRAVAGLLREIRRVRQQPVTPQELRDAIAYLSGSYVFQFETNDDLAEYLLETELYGLGINYRRTYVDRVRRVTRDELLRVARKHLHPDAAAVVIVGPDAS